MNGACMLPHRDAHRHPLHTALHSASAAKRSTFRAAARAHARRCARSGAAARLLEEPAVNHRWRTGTLVSALPEALLDLARASGFEASRCPACVAGERDDRCPNCGGSGRLWTSPHASLSDEGLARLAQLLAG